MYFTGALTLSRSSLVDHQGTISKIYFPRLLVPMAPVLAGLLDLGITSATLVGLMLFYGVTPTAMVWALPLFVLLAAATALAVGVWLSALNIVYRDVVYGVPFLLQLWFFATPVAYPSSLVPGPWRAVYRLNPMAAVVEGFRWTLLGQGRPSLSLLAASTLLVAVLLIGGLLFFQRVEQTFADVV